MPIKIYFIVVVEYYSKNTMPFVVSQRRIFNSESYYEIYEGGNYI